MNKITSFSEIGGKADEFNPLITLINELAKLHPLEYDQKRKAISDEKSIRLSTLDDLVAKARLALEEGQKTDEQFEEWAVSPWPEEVDGGQLLDDALFVLQKFVIADSESLCAAAAWVALTWLIDHATVLPMAMITAPEKGCGKSILLNVLGEMACRPLPGSSITHSALFRSIERWKPTLLIDEADSFMKDNEAMRGLLNSGHTRSSAFKILTEEIGGQLQPVKYSTWGAKAIAGIKLESLDSTLTSRSVIIPMRRKIPSEKTANFRHADPAQFSVLKSKILRWTLDNGTEFSKLRPTMPELSNRDADNWEPLLAIADLAGGSWPAKMRQAALKIVGKREETPSMEAELLRDIQNVFLSKDVKRIRSTHLLEALTADELSRWKTYNRGFPLTATQLANKLRPYGIHTGNVRIAGDGNPKGYKLEDFTETFKRYLPVSIENTDLSVTQLQAADNDNYSEFSGVTENAFVTDEDNGLSASDAECNPVTDGTGYAGEDNHIVEELF